MHRSHAHRPIYSRASLSQPHTHIDLALAPPANDPQPHRAPQPAQPPMTLEEFFYGLMRIGAAWQQLMQPFANLIVTVGNRWNAAEARVRAAK